MLEKLLKKILVIVLLSYPFFAPNTIYAQGQTVSTDPVSDTEAGSQKSNIMPIQPPVETTNLFGQDHRYSVTFRGNGEAVVLLRVALTNSSTEPLDFVQLRFPRVDPQDIMVYQVIRDMQCVEYKMVGNGQVCASYQDPDYFQTWGSSKYQKADTTYSGGTLNINLVKPIGPNKSGSYLLSYRSSGYTHKDIFSVYNYTLETIKVDDIIQHLQVGIDVDSDLYLKSSKGKVNYRIKEGSAELNTFSAIGMPSGNIRIDTLYQQIGEGNIIKTASNLQPLESYTVKGSYADTVIKLYIRNILVGLGIFLLIALVLLFIFKAIYRIIIYQRMKMSESHNSYLLSILAVGGVSFISSILIVLYSIFIWLMVHEIINSSYFGNVVVVVLFVSILSVLVYSFLILGPAIFLGFRKGWRWGLALLSGTLGWLICFMVVGFITFLILGKSQIETIDYAVGGVKPMMLQQDASSKDQ